MGQLPGWQGAENCPPGEIYSPGGAKCPRIRKELLQLQLLHMGISSRQKLPAGKFEALEKLATP